MICKPGDLVQVYSEVWGRSRDVGSRHHLLGFGLVVSVVDIDVTFGISIEEDNVVTANVYMNTGLIRVMGDQLVVIATLP